MIDKNNNVSRNDAENAVKTLLQYIGEDTQDNRIIDTPKRVVDLYRDVFDGYNKNIDDLLLKLIPASNIQDPVVVKDIYFHSFCEHHLLPFSGTISIAYEPNKYLIGIGTLSKIVEIFAARMQIQEYLTSQIAEAIFTSALQPKRVVVSINAKHECMSIRNPMTTNSTVSSIYFCGNFDSEASKEYFFNMLK